jgi:hypothetical protein
VARQSRCTVFSYIQDSLGMEICSTTEHASAIVPLGIGYLILYIA